MIRDRLKRKILDVLNIPPRICSEDFNLKTQDSSEKTDVRIEYIFNPQNYYKASIPNSKVEQSPKTSNDQMFGAIGVLSGYTKADFEIIVEYAPGEVSIVEKSRVLGTSALLESLQSWINRIDDDIKNVPIYRELAQRQEFLDALEEQLKNIPNEYANTEQINQLKASILTIEQTLKEQIEALDIESKEKSKKIEELEAQFQFLQERLATTPIKTIIRATISRAYKIVSDPKLPIIAENTRQIIKAITGGASHDN